MSTVLDVAVCLLLVGVAVATLSAAGAPTSPDDGPDADPTAAVLATSTASVQAGGDRLAHDTYAGHLRTAAVAAATLHGDQLLVTPYPAAVRTETAAVVDESASVTATWEPYPGSPIGGRLAVGEPPPPDADVAATAMTLDSGLHGPVTGEDFDELAEGIARAYVRWLLPPARTVLPPAHTGSTPADDRMAARSVDRYGAVAAAIGVDVEASLATGNVERANDRLVDALAAPLAADLEERYRSPGEAAADLAVGEVEVVVRRWDP